MGNNRKQYKIDHRRDGQVEGHFFAASPAEWRVDRDPHKLVAYMRRAGQGAYNLPFSIWYIPLPIDAIYGIADYSPEVEGAIFMVSYGRDALEAANTERTKKM